LPAPLLKPYPLVVEAKGGKKERMLTMAQIQNIRFMRNFKGLSLRAVAKETGHHFETLKKYVKKMILIFNCERNNIGRANSTRLKS